MNDTQAIAIVAYEDRFADAFARLNREWLDGFGLYEEADEKQLYSPRETILETGGEIFIAVKGSDVVGTCALERISSTLYGLAKLAVAREARGQGLGRRLTLVAVERARVLGATRVALISSTKLTPALALYESLGFERKTLPSDQPYETADVYMELDLGGSESEPA
jgi:putative acetyltransferase